MAGTGIHSFAKLRGQIPRFVTTGITFWQTAVKCAVDCQAPRSGSMESMRSGQACGNLLSNLDACLWQSAVWLCCNIWHIAMVVAIGGLNISDCHDSRYTFERGASE
jgi:hypothetical protein